MTGSEAATFLRAGSRCRFVGPGGRTHGGLRFVWDGTVLWVELRAPVEVSEATVLVEHAAVEFPLLHGVQVRGAATFVPAGAAGAKLAERLFAVKHPGSAAGRHGWLLVLPERIHGWDLA